MAIAAIRALQRQKRLPAGKMTCARRKKSQRERKRPPKSPTSSFAAAKFRNFVEWSAEADRHPSLKPEEGKKPSTTSESSYARISRFDFSISRFSTLIAYCYVYLGELYKISKLCKSAYFSRFQETSHESSLRNLSSPSCTLLTEGPSSPGLTSLDQKWNENERSSSRDKPSLSVEPLSVRPARLVARVKVLLQQLAGVVLQ